MADTAAHLVDRVLPEVPVRQWVLSLPHALRYRLAYDHRLCTDVLGLFIRTVFGALRRRARAACGEAGRSAACGAVTFVQRCGDALNVNVHFHSLILDGVYLEGGGGRLRFHPLPPPTDEEVARITATVARRLERLLERRGFFEPGAPEADAPGTEGPLLAELCAASVSGRVGTGPRRGHRLLRLGDRIDIEDLATVEGPRCAKLGGVSLHANVAVPARDRKRLERLCRYAARPPVSSERLSRHPDGRVLYRLKRRWRDGTTHFLFDPLDFLGKLASLVPPPRAHLVRYHGVLAPAAHGRAAVVADRPSKRARSAEHPTEMSTSGSASNESQLTAARGTPAPVPSASVVESSAGLERAAGGAEACRVGAPVPPPRTRRLSWAELMRRIFAVDILECGRCQGRMRILAVIEQPEVIAKILTHLGLPARAPPPSPLRRDLLSAFDEEAAGEGV